MTAPHRPSLREALAAAMDESDGYATLDHDFYPYMEKRAEGLMHAMAKHGLRVALATPPQPAEPHAHPLYDCGGKGHGSDASEVQWCHDCTPHTPPQPALDVEPGPDLETALTMLRLLVHASRSHIQHWHGSRPADQRGNHPLGEWTGAVNLAAEVLGEPPVTREKRRQEAKRAAYQRAAYAQDAAAGGEGEG